MSTAPWQEVGPSWGTATADPVVAPAGPDGPPGDPSPVAPLTSWGCDRATVLSPMTPCTEGARVAGTTGASRVNRATLPPGNLVSTRETSSARWTVATGPLTGTSSPSDEVAPTCRPVADSQARVALMVAGAGPNSEANRPGARKWWYCGDRGAETAVTNASSAAGSRGLSETSAETVAVVSLGPMTEAPAGRVGAPPAGRSETEGPPPTPAAPAGVGSPAVQAAASTTSATAVSGPSRCLSMADSLA